MNNKADPFDLSSGVPKIDGDLRPKPKIAERISKRVLFVVFGIIVVVIMTFLFALDGMENKHPVKEEEKKIPVTSDGKAPSNLLDIGRAVLGGDGGSANLVTSEKSAPSPIPPSVPAIADASQIPEMKSAAPLTPEQQQKLAEEQARHQRMQQARAQGMAAKPFVDSSGGGAGATGQETQLAALIAKSGGGGGDGMQPVSFPGGVPGVGGGVAQVEGDQERKESFLAKSASEKQGYHPHQVVAATSKNEIKTGSFIPMVLEQSINSDLPGQITARVTEDVYDSITGCRMLIPAMAKVVGRYDSKVALGQGRMLIAWNSLVFPDGAELNLAGLQGYDVSGQAGLESDVDNHYWRLFGLTFGLSMITAGVQLSVPQPNPGENGSSSVQTPSQIIAASLAQQYGTLGSQIIGRYMSVQPTLRNVAGERFVVMVPRTIVFNKIWRQRCG